MKRSHSYRPQFARVIAGLCLLAGCVLSAPQPSRAAGPLGINIGGGDFVNVMFNSLFYPLAPAASLPLDDHGWPTADFACIVFDKRVNMSWNGPDPVAVPEDVSGTYHLSFAGKADVTPDECTFTVQHVSYDPATNRTMAEVVLPPGQQFFKMDFKNTQGGAKDIRLIRPGYPANTTEIYTKAYLRALKPFAAIRVMDIQGINNYVAFTGKNTTVTEWSSRQQTSDATQTTIGTHIGVALEYLIDLVNVTGKDLWVNVPMNASDDYVTQMATLLKNQVKPGLHIYVEYSNEVWNGGFQQSWWNQAVANNAVAAGHSVLNSDGETNKYIWSIRQYTKRTIEISKIFQQVFGAKSLDTRIRPVLCWQTSSGDTVREMMIWAEAHYGPISHFLYAIGDGNYFTPTDTSSVDAIFKSQEAAMKDLSTDNANFALVAHTYGVHRVVYEGGSDMSGAKDLPNKLAANRDPRITKDIRDFLLNDYFAHGGDLFCYYDLNHGFGPYGNWGLVDRDVTKLDSVKYRGAMEALAAPQPPVSDGVALPIAVGQSILLDFGPVLASGVPVGQIRDRYLLNAKVGGVYALTITGHAAAGGLLDIIADDDLAGTITLPPSATDAPSKPITLNWAAGLHGLRIRGTGTAVTYPKPENGITIKRLK